MRFTAAKWILTAILSTTAFATASIATDVEACCGLFGRSFGCCGAGYSTYYGPRMGGCGPYGCGTSYYGPVGWGGCSTCGPVCSPCGATCSPCGSSCSPCGGVACAPCQSGSCAATAPSTLSPVPNDQWKEKKKTYAEPAPGDTGTESGEPGRTGRTDSEAGANNSGTPNRLKDAAAEGFQPVEKAVNSGTDSTIDETGTKAGGSGASKKSKKGPSTPKIDDDGQGAGKAPTISIDEKVAWRSAPIRTRIDAKPHVASARLVRLPAYPKSDWLPIESESKVANRK